MYAFHTFALMKGLKKYIAKYGRHFTEELVKCSIPIVLSEKDIHRVSSRKVWYNVSQATRWDIVYLANLAYSYRKCKGFNTKTKCVQYALDIVGNYCNRDCAFNTWLSTVDRKFDFNPFL